jgi:excisionase family DNA binding protein
VTELADNLIELVRPALEQIVDARVEEQLRLFVPPQPDVWMNTEEAAQYLRLDPEALAKRARRGTVPAHKDGRRWLFRRDELDAMLGPEVSNPEVTLLPSRDQSTEMVVAPRSPKPGP